MVGMHSPRNWPPPQQATPETERRYKEELREHLFQQMVATAILEHFADDLYEAGFTPEQIRELADAYGELTEQDKLVALAYPASLRPKLFERYAKRIEQGEITLEEMVAEMRDKAKEKGYRIAFHLSDADIKPSKDDWLVVGKEIDHRHDDRPMAYYSLDYTNRYLTKPSRFLYVIRIETGEESAHYRDNNGKWGHASTLPIVDKIDMVAVEKTLDERMRERIQENEKGKAA
jgi:hypothetical protein